VVYESKLETSNTAFIPQWYLYLTFVSVEKSVLNVECPENLGWSLILKISRSKTTDTATQLSYTASNISAQNKRIIVRHLVPFT
jgi:hypothetical protein